MDFEALIVAILWGGVVGLIAWWFGGALATGVVEAGESELKSSDEAFAELSTRFSPQTYLALRVFGALILFGIGFVAVNAVAGAMLSSVAFIVPWFLLRRARAQRVRKVELQLVEGLELLGSSLKSGLTLPQAMELLVKEFPPPISHEFRLVLNEARLGVDVVEGLQNMAERLGSTIVSVLATGVGVTKRCGGDLTVIFGNIASTIREQATIEGKLKAVTAQGRFQGLILSIMPFALIIVLWFIDRTHVETLFGYTIGVWALLAVIIMVVLAQLWITKLLKIDV